MPAAPVQRENHFGYKSHSSAKNAVTGALSIHFRLKLTSPGVSLPTGEPEAFVIWGFQ
ncbi:hypothetical protein [Sphingomonas carotinifaciens]|uniref:hypothetical protein n=1 Tax=Sphingomonas carotinifaciens TaxID=1166323 RepID=UPI001374CDBD|nr:hypothetical protein [Sphingomonas carotinifaciens]